MAFNAKEAYVVARKFGPDYNRKFIVKAQVRQNIVKNVDLSQWEKSGIFQRELVSRGDSYCKYSRGSLRGSKKYVWKDLGMSRVWKARFPLSMCLHYRRT